MRFRVLRRHGVRQCRKQKKHTSGNNITQSDGSSLMVNKIRMIDDSKRSLSNSMLQRFCETIDLVDTCTLTSMRTKHLLAKRTRA